MSLYKLTSDEILELAGQGLKAPLSKEDVFSSEIDLNILKRIDKIFNKGLLYYQDPTIPLQSKEASIFFRKSRFGTDLNLGARKIVNNFEEYKIYLAGLAKLANLKIERILPAFSIFNNPKEVAQIIKGLLYPEFDKNKKGFLKSLIFQLAEHNILVFEFVETWNKKEKANIDGFFLHPNVIVLKRQQYSFRREIFTLVHELGHFLINEEEVEKVDVAEIAINVTSAKERWCNDFAYYFLAGDFNDTIDSINFADSSNDYHIDLIESIADKTHLCPIAIYTRLLFEKKINQKDYNLIKKDIDEKFRLNLAKEKQQKEIDKMMGIKKGGSQPQPIRSPLLVSTIQAAFYEGLINEYEAAKRLNLRPAERNEFLI